MKTIMPFEVATVVHRPRRIADLHARYSASKRGRTAKWAFEAVEHDPTRRMKTIMSFEIAAQHPHNSCLRRGRATERESAWRARPTADFSNPQKSFGRVLAFTKTRPNLLGQFRHFWRGGRDSNP